MTLPRFDEIRPSPRTLSVTGSLTSATAVHASIAGAASPQVVTTALTNPVPAATIQANKSPIGRIVTVTTSTSAASYNVGAGNALTVKGADANGVAISDTLTLTAAGGNETVATSKAFVTVTEIDIPTQPNTSGAFTFGVSDLVFSDPPREIRAAGTGALGLTFADGGTDTIPLVLAGDRLSYAPTKINAATTTISAGLTFAF
jgi:hypothetical protein